MSAVDLIILGVVLVSAGISFFRGFIREVLSLAAWATSVWIAITYTPAFSDLLAPHIQLDTLRIATAFLILFVGCLILAAILNKLAGQLIKHTGFSGTDRVLGIVFGAARGGVIIATVVWLAGMTPAPQSLWWTQSLLVGQFEQLAYVIKDSLPPEISRHFSYQVPFMGQDS
jgi:membrane protein required for colicin V production